MCSATALPPISDSCLHRPASYPPAKLPTRPPANLSTARTPIYLSSSLSAHPPIYMPTCCRPDPLPPRRPSPPLPLWAPSRRGAPRPTLRRPAAAAGGLHPRDAGGQGACVSLSVPVSVSVPVPVSVPVSVPVPVSVSGGGCGARVVRRTPHARSCAHPDSIGACVRACVSGCRGVGVRLCVGACRCVSVRRCPCLSVSVSRCVGVSVWQ